MSASIHAIVRAVRRVAARPLVLALVLALVLPALAAAPAQAVDDGSRSPAIKPAAGAASTPWQTQRAGRRPTVSAVAPSSGPVLGGTKITVRGTRFAKVTAVLVGGAKASRVRVRSTTQLTAVTPVGFAGSAPVVVKTRAGKSRATTASRFAYVDPPAQDRTDIAPATGTVTGSGVVWVTGGTDVDNPQGGLPAPWVVGIGASGAVPAVGDDYYLAPGDQAFPSGLAGRVTVVANQADDVTAVTVEPAPLDQVLDKVDISYSDGAPGGAAREISDGGLSFPRLGPSSFLCTNQNGSEASFRGSLNLQLENVTKSFDLQTGNAFARGYLSAWVRYEPVLSGKVTASGSLNCKIKPAWQNANRKIIPFGTTGATLSFAPAAKFSISGSGTIELTQRSRRMIGVSVFDGAADYIDVRKDLGLSVDAAALTVTVTAEAGVSAQFGALDRVGVEAKAVLSASGKVTAKSDPIRACVDLVLGVKLSVNLFLDVWVRRWTSPGYSRTWPFAEWHKCTAGTGGAEDTGAPVITVSRLQNAFQRSDYSDYLATQDDRAGVWSIDTSRFPTGLFLGRSTGQVYGTATANVGDYAFAVTFTDAQGRTDTQVVRLYVGPPRPVNGGDFQATLTWGTAADLDLFVTDPFGEAVWYGSPASSSGGLLDRDANAGCASVSPSPIENVYWPPAGAPAGSYVVQVSQWSSCGAGVGWRLVVRVRGSVVLDTTGSGSSGTYRVTVGANRVRVERAPAADALVAPKH